MSEHTIFCRGRDYQVEVEQRSKAVFLATGEYGGSRIQTKGHTPGVALKRWREAAYWRVD